MTEEYIRKANRAKRWTADLKQQCNDLKDILVIFHDEVKADADGLTQKEKADYGEKFNDILTRINMLRELTYLAMYKLRDLPDTEEIERGE